MIEESISAHTPGDHASGALTSGSLTSDFHNTSGSLTSASLTSEFHNTSGSHTSAREIPVQRLRRVVPAASLFASDATSLSLPSPIVLASGRRVSKQFLFRVLHSGGWLAFGVVSCAWGISGEGFFPALVNNSLFILCGGLLTLALRSMYRHARAVRLPYPILAGAILFAGLFGAPLWYAVHLATLRAGLAALNSVGTLRPIFAPIAAAMSLQPWRIPFGDWFVYGFALLTWSTLYFGINSVLALEFERTRVVTAMKLADTARLRALQSQLNPHFLFNSLNGITTLIREHNATAAAALVSTLSDFLRSTLQTLDSPEISVAEELVFIAQYLKIQHLRFGDRLRSHITADDETRTALLPTLALQPLVENAVRHGVLVREDGGSVYVSILKAGAELVITVEDDGPGPPAASAQSLGVGLSNTAERLDALYGSKGSMSIGRSDRGGFAVVLRLPFRETIDAKLRQELRVEPR